MGAEQKKVVRIGVIQDLGYNPGTAFNAPYPRLTAQRGPQEWECESSGPKAASVRTHQVNDNY